MKDLDKNPAPQTTVLDLVLPRLSGIDVAQELKARPGTAAVPIIVVTGIAGFDGADLDFDCVFRKRLSAETLVSAVDDCVRRARAKSL